MTEEKGFTFGGAGGARVGEANRVKKVGTKRANELLSKIAEATMPKMKKGVKGMNKILRADEGPYLKMVSEDGTIKYVAWSDLFNTLWDDYVRGMLPNNYTRGILFDLGLTSHQVWHAMEQLQLGRGEYTESDYLEVQYV